MSTNRYNSNNSLDHPGQYSGGCFVLFWGFVIFALNSEPMTTRWCVLWALALVFFISCIFFLIMFLVYKVNEQMKKGVDDSHWRDVDQEMRNINENFAYQSALRAEQLERAKMMEAEAERMKMSRASASGKRASSSGEPQASHKGGTSR